jgi:hypothetical protein
MTMPAEPKLLILDYPGRRADAHVSEMRLEEHGFDCEYGLAAPLPTALTTLGYAGQLHERLRPGRPAAVISYCGAAPLAIAMARLLEGPDGDPVPIAFLNPSPTPPSDIVREYAAAVRQVEGRAPRVERPPLLDIEGLLSAPELLVRRIEEDLRLRARLTLEAYGLAGTDTSGQTDTVVGMYVEWLIFHVAAHHAGQQAPSGDVLQVISQEQPADASWLGAPVQTVRVPCELARLAAHEDARTAVLDFLEGTGHEG